jgi:PAS domain S-box-containing protein
LNWDSEDNIMYGSGRDGTDRKKAEILRQSLETINKRYEYATKATSDAIWDWDLKSNSLHWGEGFQTVFGYDLNKIKQDIDSWTDFIHPEDADSVISSVHEVIDGGQTTWKREYRFRRGDGSYSDVVDRGFVIRDDEGKAIRMVGAQHDISERKKSLANLKQLAEDLNKRNRELTQFGYVVSHNLRSPVANIIGLAALLESDRENAETVDYCIQSIKASASSLDEVIIDLTQILTVTDGSAEMPKEAVDLVEVINKVCVDLADVLTETKATVEVPLGRYVLFTHKAYIYSVFLNLISNAIKYRSNEPLMVSISITNTAKTLVIDVIDNGIGIDLERHQNDLFKPYKRFNREKNGKGLGLFLVKSHIEALHGIIIVQSEPGRGSTFTIVFPTEVLSLTS